MPRTTRPSVTFTALIWLGMLLTLGGAIVALLGIGTAVEFKAKIGDGEVTTTNLGLAIMAIGAILAALVATKLPKGITVFAVSKPTWGDRFSENSGWLVAFAVLTIILLGFSLWRH